MKKIVILGDPNSIWVQVYVSQVLTNPKYKVYILYDKEYPVDKSNVFENVVLVPCRIERIPNNSKFQAACYFIRMFLFFLSIGKVDCIHVQYVNRRKLTAIKLFRKWTDKVVCTFWGSDLLRKNQKEMQFYQKNLLYADKITVGSSKMKMFFDENYQSELAKKVSVVRFGVQGIDEIIRLKHNQSRFLGIPSDALVVAVGYNGSAEQNHLEVLNNIRKLPQDLLQKLFFVFPMTYGADKDYVNNIKENANEIGICFTILQDYMNITQMAELELSIDVFVHAQNTDALSATVQEFLAAGKLVLNPAWIKYQELEDADVFIYEYSTFSEIPIILQSLVENGLCEKEKYRLKENELIMRDFSSWEKLRNNWLALY